MAFASSNMQSQQSTYILTGSNPDLDEINFRFHIADINSSQKTTYTKKYTKKQLNSPGLMSAEDTLRRFEAKMQGRQWLST
jgi:hypothetical protein